MKPIKIECTLKAITALVSKLVPLPKEEAKLPTAKEKQANVRAMLNKIGTIGIHGTLEFNEINGEEIPPVIIKLEKPE